MTDQELKTKVKASMEEYLTKNNLLYTFANLQNIQQNLNQHLPRMWQKFETEGLMEPLKTKGYTYQRFVNTAFQKAQEVNILRQMFGRGGFRF